MSDLISREETYKVLTDYYHHTTETQHSGLRDALGRVPSADYIEQIRWERDTAIQQLKDLGYLLGEKPRHGDLISRQKAIETAENMYGVCDTGYMTDYKDLVIEALEELPSANQWIPCSERLPEKEGRYWVWAEKYFTPDHNDMPNSYKGSTEASFLRGHWYGNSIGEVFAWMPLPTPYRGGMNDGRTD